MQKRQALSFVLGLCLILSPGILAGAQESDFAIERVNASLQPPSIGDKSGHWTVNVVFTQDVDARDLQSANGQARFEIFDLSSGKATAVVLAGADGPEANANLDANHPRVYHLTLGANVLDSSHSYVLYIVGFPRKGASVGDLHGNLAFLEAPTALAGKSKSGLQTKRTISIVTPIVIADKDLSDIYIAGEVDFTGGKKVAGERTVNGIADIKVAFPFFLPLAGNVQMLSPEFNLQASSVANHDDNAMNIGLAWDSPFQSTLLVFRKEFKVESTKNFSHSNGLVAASLRYPINDTVLKIPHLAITPYGGGEFGGNFANPSPTAEGSKIARGVFGSDLNIYFNLQRVGFRGVGLDANFVSRIIATREFAGLQPGDHREHAGATIKFAFSSNMGATFGYEWGALPPTYQYIHNLFTIGFLYQAQIKPR